MKRTGCSLVEVLIALVIVCSALCTVASVRAAGHRVLVHAEDVESLQAAAHQLLAAAADEEFEVLLRAVRDHGGAVPRAWIEAALGRPAPGISARVERTGRHDILRFRATAELAVAGRTVRPVVQAERLVVRADASLWQAIPMEVAR